MSNDDESFAEEVEEITTGESEVLHDLGKGAIAGLVAAIPVGLLLLLKGATGFLPEVNMLGSLAHLTGLEWAGAAWIALLIGGTLLGIAFAALDAHVGRVTGANEMIHGALFGFLLWGALVILYLPFYAEASFATVLFATLLGMSLVYGVVMGAIYGAMNPEEVPA